MDQIKIGVFIAALRKEQGLTQRQLAEELGISDKTVSKWERDEGCPEIMMLPLIAELYSVTVDEILRGEKIRIRQQPNVRSPLLLSRVDRQSPRLNERFLRFYIKLFRPPQT